jgi:hypothetical protein
MSPFKQIDAFNTASVHLSEHLSYFRRHCSSNLAVLPLLAGQMVYSSHCKVRTHSTGRRTYLERPYARAIPSARQRHDTWVAVTAVAVAAGVADAVLRSFQSLLLLQSSVDPTDQLEPVEIPRQGIVQRYSDQASFLAFHQTSSLEASGIETL